MIDRPSTSRSRCRTSNGNAFRPGGSRAVQAAQTRQRIVHAARLVFSELGYDGATFKAIAMRADLTRPAVNHYFPNMRGLYREVVEQTNALVHTGAIEKAGGEPTLLGQMSAFIAAAVQADSKDRWAAAFLLTEVLESHRHPELRHPEHDGVTNTRAFLAAAVNRAIDRGELAVAGDVSALVEMLLAVLWGMGFYAGFVGNHDELAAVTDQLGRLLVGDLWHISEEVQ
jgi:AcrR family transcriptional regulator